MKIMTFGVKKSDFWDEKVENLMKKCENLMKIGPKNGENPPK